jgi:hypothetical protein
LLGPQVPDADFPVVGQGGHRLGVGRERDRDQVGGVRKRGDFVTGQ